MNCQFCGRELKNQGAKNLHERKCAENPANKGEQNEHKNDNSKPHKCSFRFLNPSKPDERKAINLGYTKICKDTDCEEVI